VLNKHDDNWMFEIEKQEEYDIDTINAITIELDIYYDGKHDKNIYDISQKSLLTKSIKK
jgi:hypothetical protein